MTKISVAFRKVNYSGPLVGGVDETKLKESLRLWKSTENKVYIIGGVKGEKEISRVEEIESKTSEIKSNDGIADKVRTHLISIPLPKFPSEVALLTPTAGNVQGKDHFSADLAFLEAAWSQGLKVISIGQDGAATEQKSAQMLSDEFSKSRHFLTFEDKHTNVLLKTPIITRTTTSGEIIKMPFMTIQDSKHAAKTGRNQIFSGARLLCSGNDSIQYGQLLKFSQSRYSTIYKRDVVNTDKQDDKAAARLYAAKTLSRLIKMDGNEFLVIYLFLIGELISAWQTRHLPHIIRIKIAMRTYFFLRGSFQFISSLRM